MRTKLSWGVLVALATATTLGHAAADEVVQTQSGRVAGVEDGAGVTAFRGLPYAMPPVGALRWRPPQPAAAWTGIRSGAAFGPVCPQPVSPRRPIDPIDPAADVVSEDCLTLNIWRPAGAPADAKLPVLFWIHGGAFVSGAGSRPGLNGGSFAKQGLVVVTINYRLGPLGFLAHPLLTAEGGKQKSGNHGLLDQVAALQWVQRNIAAFGGDPAQVTIAGHSAGGVSVATLLASPLAQGLFARAIDQSGPVEGITQTTRTLAQAEALGETFLGNRGATDLQAMRALPVSALLAADPRDPAQRATWAPMVDGHVTPTLPADAYLAGRQAHVPLMMGVASFESGAMFARGTPREQLSRLAAVFHGDRQDLVLSHYPHATDDAAAQATGLMLGDPMFAATLAYASCHLRTGSPTWIYVFDHTPPGPASAREGAFHGAELPYMFDNLQYTLRPWTDTDRALAKTMLRRWTQFVKTGNPNADGLPRWQPFNGALDSMAQLRADGPARPLPTAARIQLYFPDLTPYSRPPGSPATGQTCALKP